MSESAFTSVKSCQGPAVAAQGALQRQCACGQHKLGGECESCRNEIKNSRIQRREIGRRTPPNVPSVVDDALQSPGQALDSATRSFFEPRFRHDFSQVRVHANEKAAEAARAINAVAYTVGQDIVFGERARMSGGPGGKHLLAHELTHVVQQRRGSANHSTGIQLADPSGAAEVEADAAERAASEGSFLNVNSSSELSVQRKVDKRGDVSLGKFRFEMEEDPGKGKESVTITFSPDPKGPSTESINLIQIAKSDIPWAQVHPDQADVEEFTTKPADRIHQTGTGDTLESISIMHYSTPTKAPAIAEANHDVLPTADTRSTLAPGLKLKLPEAVEGGFHVDVRPDLDPNMHPRWNKADAPVSPAYPPASTARTSQSSVDPTSGLTMGSSGSVGPTPGHNRPGDQLDAKITDLPGGGSHSSWYKFETVAHSDDLGINYGAAHWGFFYGGPGSKPLYSQETCEFSSNVSDTFAASLVAFNKFYMNKHVVQKDETLRSVATLYFGNDSAAHSIYLINKDTLKSEDIDAAIPVGTSLEMPNQGRAWRSAKKFGDSPAGKAQ